MVMILDSGSRDMGSNPVSSSKNNKMKYNIGVFAEIGTFDYYCGEESYYTRSVRVLVFEIDFDGCKKMLDNYLLNISSSVEGIKYEIVLDTESEIVNSPESFSLGFDKFVDYKKFESDRLSNNRNIRGKIKDLKEAKKNMSRSEVIKSKINKELLDLKKSIR